MFYNGYGYGVYFLTDRSMKKLNIKNLVKLILNEYLTITSSGDGYKYSLDEKSDMISDKVR